MYSAGVGCHYHAKSELFDYRCDNVLLNYEVYPPSNCETFTWGCVYSSGSGYQLPLGCGLSDYPGDQCEEGCEGCTGTDCIYEGGNCGVYDKRTQEMKDAGCCPINPMTGLPY
jgi:hypothetical protein